MGPFGDMHTWVLACMIYSSIYTSQIEYHGGMGVGDQSANLEGLAAMNSSVGYAGGEQPIV